MISANGTEQFVAILYLIIYNLIFILPLVAIVILVATGIASVKELQKKRMQNIRLIHGIV
jgi:cytochrome c biogenesis protein CcdA